MITLSVHHAIGCECTAVDALLFKHTIAEVDSQINDTMLYDRHVLVVIMEFDVHILDNQITSC